MNVADLKDLLRAPVMGRPDLVEHLDAFDERAAKPIFNAWREEQPHPKRGYVAVDDALLAKLLAQWEPHLGSAALLAPRFGLRSKRQAIFLAQVLSLCHGQAHPWRSSLYKYHHSRAGNDPHEALHRIRAAGEDAAAARPAGLVSEQLIKW